MTHHNLLKLNTMNTFNLNDLRADVAYHSDWFIFGFEDHDAMIDYITNGLIGSEEMELMLLYPFTRVRFISVHQDTTLILSLS